MKNKKILLFAFLLVVIAQILIPSKMIYDQEVILDKGTVFKFETAPIDPNDPFRGKYITLHYKANTFEVLNGDDWEKNENVFVILTEDVNGFAKIQSLSKVKPLESVDFVHAKINKSLFTKKNKIIVDYPFNRFYMKETKARNAENVYREASKNNKKNAYALVYILDGKTVLDDVVIDGISINDIENITE